MKEQPTAPHVDERSPSTAEHARVHYRLFACQSEQEAGRSQPSQSRTVADLRRQKAGLFWRRRRREKAVYS